jgi:hypothetical protein
VRVGGGAVFCVVLPHEYPSAAPMCWLEGDDPCGLTNTRTTEPAAIDSEFWPGVVMVRYHK